MIPVYGAMDVIRDVLNEVDDAMPETTRPWCCPGFLIRPDAPIPAAGETCDRRRRARHQPGMDDCLTHSRDHTACRRPCCPTHIQHCGTTGARPFGLRLARPGACMAALSTSTYRATKPSIPRPLITREVISTSAACLSPPIGTPVCPASRHHAQISPLYHLARNPRHRARLGVVTAAAVTGINRLQFHPRCGFVFRHE